jgi:UDP-glucose 4-epimerase
MSFRGAKVVVPGGAGFIGSNLARRLVSDGADVTLVDSLIPEYGGNLFNIRDIRDQVNLNISDVRDEHSMSYLVRGVDYLFNLAGQTSHLDSMINPYADLDINCRAQLSILEACRKVNPRIKIVFASTRQIYGAPEYLPVDERHPQRPVDVNGINKMAGEWYHLIFNNVYEISSAVLRLTNTYGPGMRVKDARQTFLGIWIRRLLEGDPVSIYGDGKQIRDFNYVDDVIEAFLLAAASVEANGQIFNLGAPDPMSLNDVGQLLTTIRPGTLEIIPFPDDRKAIDIGDYYSDYSRIHSTLNWSPIVGFPEGLKKTVEYYAENLAHYVDCDPS